MPTKRPTTTEHAEQAAIVQWARMSQGRYPCLRWLHSSLNGIWLGSGPARFAIMAKQKQAGQVNGIPDLSLPYPARGFFGLYIEMKKPGKMGEVSPEQKDFLAYAESAGYLAQAFDCATDAIAAIQDYLNGPRTVAR